MAEEELKIKTQKLMYALLKNAARSSFVQFLDDQGLTEEEFEEIKDFIVEKTGIDGKKIYL